MDGSIFLVGEKVFTLFLILFAGIYARKINILDQAATKKLSALLLNITQPLMIITSFQMEFDVGKLKEGAGIFALSAAIHIITAAGVLLFFKPVRDFEQRKVYRMCTLFGNVGFLGFPVLSIVFGDNTGVFYGAFYNMFFNMFIWTYGVFLMSQKEDARNKIKLPLKKIIFNAGMLSSLTGIIMFVLRIRTPPFLLNSMELLGGMTFPLAMVIIGSLIYDIKFKDVLADKKIYYFMFVKLIALPVLVLLAGRLLNLPRLFVYMGALMSAMPSAAMAAIFAETYESDAKSGAAAVGTSTLFSVITIPAVIWLAELVLA